jgi:hypothetical protein
MATEAALLVYVALATIVQLRLSRVRQTHTFGWVAERRQPTPEETAAVVRFPSVEAGQLFGWWEGGALLVTAIDLGISTPGTASGWVCSPSAQPGPPESPSSRYNRSRNARNARPRWLRRCFSPAVISANVRPSASTGAMIGS